jgi:hypothetical protein
MILSHTHAHKSSRRRTMENTQMQNGQENAGQSGWSGNTWMWVAGAVGTAAGIAAIAYSRKPKSRWERAQCALQDGAEMAGKKLKPVVNAAKPVIGAAKPWMGAAGLAAGCAALAFRSRRQSTMWDQVRDQAAKVRDQAADLIPKAAKMMA